MKTSPKFIAALAECLGSALSHLLRQALISMTRLFAAFAVLAIIHISPNAAAQADATKSGGDSTPSPTPAVEQKVVGDDVSEKAPPPVEVAELEVEWQGRWWPAVIREKAGGHTLIHYIGYGNEWDEWVPAERMRALKPEAAVAPAMPEPVRIAQLVEQNRQAARVRAAEDRQHYSTEQLQEIETLYQVANTKGKRSPEARESLRQLLEKYDKANRTGCATLYLGQASTGAERLEYLTRAVEKFSDCYYFNGCQVGGYGRYVLALTLWESGEKEKARALFEELKTKFKDATDHRGRPMSEAAEAVQKELAAKE